MSPTAMLHASLALALGAACLLTAAPVVVLAPAGPSEVAPGAGASPTPCSGPLLPTSYAGSLVVDGGPAPAPAVSGRSVSLTYWVRENYTPNGGPSTVTCLSYAVSNVTGALGSFSLSPSVPGSGCNRVSCTSYVGPLGPLYPAVVNGTPAGYFVTASVSGGSIGLHYVYALNALTTSPGGRTTLSVDAPTVIRAQPMAGDGSPSPATVGFAWSLTGSGWSVVAGAGTANLTIEAASSAGAGQLAVWANGTYNGTAESAPPAVLLLDAVATHTTGATVHPTSLDVGFPAIFDLVGSGAIGYPYTMQLFVGVGARTVNAPCVENGTNGGTEFVDCEASVQYNATGVVDPTATLTNGYSAAGVFDFPALTVAAAPALSVTPTPVVAYAGANASISLTANSGTLPLGPACFATGNGRIDCSRSAGPTWSFQVGWGAPGAYTASATVADASGANISLPVPVDIYTRPQLTNELPTSLSDVSLGTPYNLSASVTGGALPLDYWWNSSPTGATLLSGSLGADGTMFLPYVPSSVGASTVTLVVVDRLHTMLAYAFPIFVTPGMASRVAVLDGAGTDNLVAGNPYDLVWGAYDSAGVIASSYQQVGTVSVAFPSAPAAPPPVWINGSGGPLASSGGGRFTVPLSDWNNGILSLNVTVGGDAAASLNLSGGAAGAGGGTSIGLLVGPNVKALKLWDPTPSPSLGRSGSVLCRLTDRFNDNLSGGTVWVRESFGSLTSVTAAPVLVGARGSFAWINFSALSTSAGTVNVSYGSDPTPFLAWTVPAAPSTAIEQAALVAVGLALAATVVAVWYRRRHRTPRFDRGPSDGVEPATDEQLERLAKGRAHILARSDPLTGRTIDELAEGFPGAPPTPEEMTEWVASLVADGSLVSERGPAGRNGFRATAPAPPPPRVVLDDQALEEALKRRTDADGGPTDGTFERPDDRPSDR